MRVFEGQAFWEPLRDRLFGGPVSAAGEVGLVGRSGAGQSRANMDDLVVIVPARLGSQRFPGKLLVEVRGKPLILWTAENLRRAVPDWPLIFAVAEVELERVLEGAGFRTVRTDPELASGTDRLAAANEAIGARWIINAQADEPLLTGSHLRLLARLLGEGRPMATLATPFGRREDFEDPNKVKVVLGATEEVDGYPWGEALYFSRAPIPRDREEPEALPAEALWHLGLYGYSADLLERFRGWPAGRLEKRERLEQLRVLENGYKIAVGIHERRTVGVDVPEDVVELEGHLEGPEE